MTLRQYSSISKNESDYLHINLLFFFFLMLRLGIPISETDKILNKKQSDTIRTEENKSIK